MWVSEWNSRSISSRTRGENAPGIQPKATRGSLAKCKTDAHLLIGRRNCPAVVHVLRPLSQPYVTREGGVLQIIDRDGREAFRHSQNAVTADASAAPDTTTVYRSVTSIRSIKRLPLTDDGQVRQSGTERPDRPGAGELGRRVAEGLPVTERTGTFFRWELFNALDHWNYWGFEGDMTSSGFGQVTTTTDPRTEQVMLRLTF
jgi:hypothetical protein